MQDIRFDKLQFRNVRCYTESELEFPDNQLVAIVGPNGSGKSTHLMAFTAGLFGTTAEGFALSDLVNRRVDKDLEIYIDFRIDSVPYQIARFYKHKVYKNQLVLTRDGKDISRKTATETYELIESLLVPKAVFLNSIYFGQAVKDFFTCLTDKQQKEIFHSILQTQEYKVFYGETDNAMTSLRSEKDGLNVSEIQLATRKTELEKMLQVLRLELESRKEEIKSNIQECQDNIRRLQIDADHAEEELKSLDFDSDDYDRLINRIASVQSSIDRIENDLSEYVSAQKEILEQKLREIVSSCNEKISKLETQLHIKISEIDSDFSETINKLKDSISELIQKLNDKKSSHMLRKSDIEKTKFSNIAAAQESHSKCKVELDIPGLKQEIQSLEQKLVERHSFVVSDLNTIKNQLSQSESNLSQLESTLSELKCAESGSKPCPTCGQVVKDKESESKIAKARVSKETDLKSALQFVSDLRSQFDQKKKDFVEFKEEISSRIQKLKEDLDQKLILSSENDLRYEQTVDQEEQLASIEICKLQEEFDKESKAISDEIAFLQNQHRSIVKEVESKKHLLKDEYLTSVEQINSDSKELIQVEIRSSESLIEVKRSKITEDEKELRQTLIQLKNRKSEIEFVKDSISQKKSDLKDIRSKIESLTSTCKDLSSKEFDSSNISKTEDDIHNAELELLEVTKKLQSVDRNLHILSFWKEAFSDRGIPSMLIDSSIPFLNEAVKSELDIIAPGKFIVTFDTLSQTKAGDIREKFSVNVLNLENGADKHSLLSGGEKRQIDMCCMRAIRLLMENLFQKRFNITLLDEVLDSLDDENSAEFCRHIKKLATGQNVTLITHSITQNAECDQVIRCSV